MNIVVPECLVKVCGKVNVLLVIMLRCLIQKFNGILTEISKGTGLSLFVMGQNLAGIIKRGDQDQFHTKGEIQLLILVGWKTSVQKIEGGMING